MHQISNAVIVHKALNSAGDLNISCLRILIAAYIIEEKMLVHEMAKALNTSSPNISRSVEILEAEGLIKRKREEKGDRRQVRLFTTAKGNALVERIVAA
jgi:DNA-binding MarR family transcriptional regulator